MVLDHQQNTGSAQKGRLCFFLSGVMVLDRHENLQMFGFHSIT